MGIISWIVIGALAGWVASMIMKTDAQMGAIANIVVGIIGALIGGAIMSFIGKTGVYKNCGYFKDLRRRNHVIYWQNRRRRIQPLLIPGRITRCRRVVSDNQGSEANLSYAKPQPLGCRLGSNQNTQIPKATKHSNAVLYGQHFCAQFFVKLMISENVLL